MIERTGAPSASEPTGAAQRRSSTRRWTRSGRPMASRTSRSRPAPTPSSPPTSTWPRRSAASSWRSRSSRRRWTPWSTRGFAGALARLGGLAILNLEGVQARYDDPDAVLERIATAADGDVQALLAEAYQQPIREDLIARRLDEIHAAGSKAAVAATPGAARRFGPFCAEHGADLFLVQSQVSSRPPPRHRVRPAVARRVHPLHADPGRGRQHDQRRGRLRAHGAGRGGRLRRGRARAPPARPARSSASASRR